MEHHAGQPSASQYFADAVAPLITKGKFMKLRSRMETLTALSIRKGFYKGNTYVVAIWRSLSSKASTDVPERWVHIGAASDTHWVVSLAGTSSKSTGKWSRDPHQDADAIIDGIADLVRTGYRNGLWDWKSRRASTTTKVHHSQEVNVNSKTAAEVQKSLRAKLIRKAYHNPELRPSLLPVIAQLSEKTMRVAGMDLPVHVALNLQAARLAAGPMNLDRMPGFSGMQLRQQIDRVAEVQREIKIITAQYEAALKQLAGLEKEEQKGLDLLKTAASEMREKGKYVAEAETALLEFTAYLTDKRPGIEQMIANPGDSKWGDKAGDLFGRIAKKLGDDVAKDVAAIYAATKEDLTHTTMAIRGLKVVGKTAGMNDNMLKQAGIADMVVGVKEWLAGKARGFMGLVGDIGRWVKGFVERTKLVKSKTDHLEKSIADAKKEITKVLAS